MAGVRFLLISGEVLSNDDKSELIRDAFEGLSTCPPDVLQLLQENLSSLSERSESTSTDGLCSTVIFASLCKLKCAQHELFIHGGGGWSCFHAALSGFRHSFYLHFRVDV
ncbi:hypothetical protein EG68_10784 [Paragonimus skrjabini miyazakii]|uniref:Uncharacterized protein n=1 Tax=Paragonimus skrjabini miyazakii TaxID=59628 RepID=A0A8S9YK33_9TREM|nr:hypothetical protein EG68_10784 [Paragonimus skrjabini miyazakii]